MRVNKITLIAGISAALVSAQYSSSAPQDGYYPDSGEYPPAYYNGEGGLA